MYIRTTALAVVVLALAGCSLEVELAFQTEPQIFDTPGPVIYIKSTPANAKITYTIDGTDPTLESTPYPQSYGIPCPLLFAFTLKAVCPGRSGIISGEFGRSEIVTQEVNGTYELPTVLVEIPADRKHRMIGDFANPYGGEVDWMQIEFSESCTVTYKVSAGGGGGLVIFPYKGGTSLASIDDSYSTSYSDSYQEHISAGTSRTLAACQGGYYDIGWEYTLTTTADP